ncbi:MAG: hypothetical protein ABW200_18360 [Hyphomicrobiaceae bacterium]|jgi:hypothetical protein
MKLCIGKPDGSELVLAEEASGAWKPSTTIAADMAAFLAGANPEQFELWVEEDEAD